MERIIFFIFLCMAFEGDAKNHIFVREHLTWFEAQAFCREKYTDLSFVSSQKDQDEFLATAVGPGAGVGTGAGTRVQAWIGLQRDDWNKTAWKWSGGGNITYQSWDSEQPDNYQKNENNGYTLHNGKWNDLNGMVHHRPFYCINITIVDMEKTWEGAQKYCRKKGTNLTSLQTETDHRLAQKVIQKVNIIERVWIGLRYLHDRWLWVNGEPLVYKAWPQGRNQDNQCPEWKRCGTLTKGGLWEKWDCRDKLNFLCY